MDRNFETTNEAIIDWIEPKISDSCRCIGLFVNYILIHRDGFDKPIYPTLSLSIVKYVVEEIFNCSIISSLKLKNELIPLDFSTKCRKYLKQSILNTNIVIPTEVIEYLWKYISIGVSSLTEDINIKEEIQSLKSKRKLEEITIKKDAFKNFKNNINNKTNEELSLVASNKFKSYKKLIDKINGSNTSAKIFINKFNSGYGFKLYTSIIKLFYDEEQQLLEMGIKVKMINRLKEFKSIEELKNGELKNREISEEDYSGYIYSVLVEYIKYINKLMKMINESKISKSINNILNDHTVYSMKDDKPVNRIVNKISPETWEKEYIKFEEKKHVKDFLSSIEKTLSDEIKNIDENDDGSIKNIVEKKVSKIINTRIMTFQNYISQKKCTTEDFDSEIDGCIIESITYLLVTLTDWLELNYITPVEINYMLRILLPSTLLQYISKDDDDNNDGENDNIQKFKMLITKRIQKYGLKFKSDGYNSIGVIYKTLKNIDKLDHDSNDYKKFNNRIRYFANSI
jgi:hypothetical protein